MNNDGSVLIVSAAIVIVPEVEAEEVYDDLVNSVLLAQSVANKRVEKDPVSDWYYTYMGVLDDFWLRDQKSGQTWSVNNDTAEPALAFFSAALARGALDDMTTTDTVLEGLAGMSGDEPAIKLLRSCMSVSSADESPAVPAAETDVRLLLIFAQTPTSFTSAYIEFKTGQALSPNPFLQVYQPQEITGMVRVHHAKARLLETRFGPSREAIAVKVRERLAGSVAKLRLPIGIQSCREC